MPLQTDGDHQKLLTEVIKKQIVILGPDITLAKARNVKGLTVADDGTVTQITGDPQQITQQLIEQFMELSGLIVKKTLEPLLANYPGLAAPTTQPVENISPAQPQNPTATPTQVQQPETTQTVPENQGSGV